MRLPKPKLEKLQMRITAFMTTVAATLALTPVTTSAQDWPSRPVRLIAPFAAGGSADTLGRTFAEQLSGTFKQQWVVDNRTGAGGVIGSAEAARAAPDGYTFVVSSIASQVIAPATNDKVGFDTMKDFTHVAYFGGPPIVIVAHPSIGAKTFAEFKTWAKAQTTPVAYVSPGAGTLGNLVAEYWGGKDGVKVEHIPYRGAAVAITDLIAGHVKVGSMTWTSALAQIRDKRVVPLAVSSANRMPEFPDVPTLKELGYPELVATTWFSLSAPANMPKDIVEKVNAAVVAAADSPAVRKRLETEGMEIEKMSSAEFTKFMADEIAKWRPIAKQVMGTGSNG
jgi:tripartite-type tricarboxylate transporter receptor subunit TctC